MVKIVDYLVKFVGSNATTIVSIVAFFASVSTIIGVGYAFWQYREYRASNENRINVIKSGFKNEIYSNIDNVSILVSTSSNFYEKKSTRLDDVFLNKIMEELEAYKRSDVFNEFIFLTSSRIRQTNYFLEMDLSPTELLAVDWKSELEQTMSNLISIGEELNGGEKIEKDITQTTSHISFPLIGELGCKKLINVKIPIESNEYAYFDEIISDKEYWVYIKYQDKSSVRYKVIDRYKYNDSKIGYLDLIFLPQRNDFKQWLNIKDFNSHCVK